MTSDVGSAESSVGHGDGSAGAGAGFETGVLPADSVRRFPGPEDLAAAMTRAGFRDVGWRRLGGGIVALHVGRKA